MNSPFGRSLWAWFLTITLWFGVAVFAYRVLAEPVRGAVVDISLTGPSSNDATATISVVGTVNVTMSWNPATSSKQILFYCTGVSGSYRTTDYPNGQPVYSWHGCGAFIDVQVPGGHHYLAYGQSVYIDVSQVSNILIAGAVNWGYGYYYSTTKPCPNPSDTAYNTAKVSNPEGVPMKVNLYGHGLDGSQKYLGSVTVAANSTQDIPVTWDPSLYAAVDVEAEYDGYTYDSNGNLISNPGQNTIWQLGSIASQSLGSDPNGGSANVQSVNVSKTGSGPSGYITHTNAVVTPPGSGHLSITDLSSTSGAVDQLTALKLSNNQVDAINAAANKISSSVGTGGLSTVTGTVSVSGTVSVDMSTVQDELSSINSSLLTATYSDQTYTTTPTSTLSWNSTAAMAVMDKLPAAPTVSGPTGSTQSLDLAMSIPGTTIHSVHFDFSGYSGAVAALRAVFTAGLYLTFFFASVSVIRGAFTSSH